MEHLLVHSIKVIQPQANSAFGDSDGVLETEEPCLIQGSRRRVLTTNGVEVQLDFTVVFGPDTEVGIDWTLRDGRDIDGNLLLETGRIVNLLPSIHPFNGLQAQTASIVRS